MYAPPPPDLKSKGQVQQPKEEAPMNTTATVAAVNQSTANTNKQQKQTAKEAIAANVQALIEQLEQGHSEGLTAYLTAMGRFHNYSFGNILEIARQKPDATRVAGLYAWNQLGRKVKKGERGIRILAPIVGIRRKKDSEAEKDIRTQNQAVLVGFRSAYVFDVTQTEGKELPELSPSASPAAPESTATWQMPCGFCHCSGHRAGVQREHRPSFGHELRRQDRAASRTVLRRGVFNPCA